LTAPFVLALEANTVGCLATTNQDTIVGRVPFACTVTAATYVPSASIAAPASGTGRTYTVFNRGSSAIGTGTVAVATKSVTSNVGMTDNVAFDLTISATTASLICASGDVLEFDSAAVTSNAPDPGGRVIVTLSRTVV
jgi:hypothetical protein